jgi:hypothetical protein
MRILLVGEDETIDPEGLLPAIPEQIFLVSKGGRDKILVDF